MPFFNQPQPIQKLAPGQRLYNFGFTDSLLFTEAYMRPRYRGSKLVGKNINSYKENSYITTKPNFDNQNSWGKGFNLPFGGGTGTGTFLKSLKWRRLGDKTYGKNPVIEVKTSIIYEFDWGGSTYPEVEKGGSVHIKQILNVDSYTKGNPNVYIVNEATNDSFRVDTTTTNEQGANIILTDNPGEETDFSINFKRSLAFGDRITLNSYIAGNPTVDGPESVVGSINDLVNEINAVPTKNVVTLEPGLSVPSYGGIYIQRRLGGDNNITSSVTGEPVGFPFLPRFEDGNPNYVGPNVTTSPYADFYMADFQNPGGPEVLASTLRNISGSYYLPTTASFNNTDFGSVISESIYGPPFVTLSALDDWKHLKISPEGRYLSGSSASEYVVSSSLINSLVNGNRHFISFYESLGNIAAGDLNQVGEPIEIKEVKGRLKGALWNVDIILKNNPPITGVIGNGKIGILVWKAQQGPFAVMKPTDIAADYSYRFLKTGGFYREHSTSTIKQHFDDIVKTVGMKPSL